MNNYLVITIDTEIDSPKWKPEFPYSLDNIKAIPKLQKLLKKYDAKATYLVTYPVATNEESINMFQGFLENNEIEIGAHLHPWTNPPFVSEKEKFQLGYPHHSQLEFKKLTNLTEVIENSFRKKPVCYRAGRYGFDEQSLEYLENLGYLIDTSISPDVNWSFDNGPDFSGIEKTQPYFLNRNNIKIAGKSKILEVPLSIMINKNLPVWLKKLYLKSPFEIKAVFKKLGLIKTVWLRPSIASFEEMKFLCDFLMLDGNKVLNMMFHSNELMPSTSPYIKSQKQADNFFLRLDKILNYLIFQKKVKSKTLSEIYEIMNPQSI